MSRGLNWLLFVLVDLGEIGERSRARSVVLLPPPPLEARELLFAMLGRCMAILFYSIDCLCTAEVTKKGCVTTIPRLWD